MRKQPLKEHLARSVVQFTLLGVLIAIAPSPTHAQGDAANLVRLFRLDGTFSEELSAKTRSDKSKAPRFTLTKARLEADNIGSLTRLRAMLTIANDDIKGHITEVEWRLDVYDASLRSVSARVLQADKVNIYAGETGVASAKLGAVLPDSMVVLLQIAKVSFADGSAWLAAGECSLGDDLRTVSCKSK